jgi:hypothetical protein
MGGQNVTREHRGRQWHTLGEQNHVDEGKATVRSRRLLFVITEGEKGMGVGVWRGTHGEEEEGVGSGRRTLKQGRGQHRPGCGGTRARWTQGRKREGRETDPWVGPVEWAPAAGLNKFKTISKPNQTCSNLIRFKMNIPELEKIIIKYVKGLM